MMPAHIKEVKLPAAQKVLIVYLIAESFRLVLNIFPDRFGDFSKTC